jgi:hypothetical protein
MEELASGVSSACAAMCRAMLSNLLRPTIFDLFSFELGNIIDLAVKLRVWANGCLRTLFGTSRLIVFGLPN